MKYEWTDGFHAPKGVSAKQAKEAIDDLSEPSPSLLVAASERKTHVLHAEFWAEDDAAWAQRGREQRARQIIASIKEELVIGGKTYICRSYEFIKPNGEGRWAEMKKIVSNPANLDAYFEAVEMLQKQAMEKMALVRQLLREPK